MSKHFIRDCHLCLQTYSPSISTSFGPLGNNHLVVSEELGTMVVNKSGISILYELSKSKDCIAKLLGGMVYQFSQEHGDGSSGLFLMLSSAISTLSRLDLCLADMVKLRDFGFSRVRQMLLNGTLLAKLPKAIFVGERAEQVLREILETTLKGQFNQRVETQLATFTLSWVQACVKINPCHSRRSIVEYLLDEFDSMCINCYPSSRIELSLLGENSCVIDKPPLHRVKGRGDSMLAEYVSETPLFIVFMCPLCEMSQNSNGHKVAVQSAESLVQTAGYIASRTEELLREVIRLVPDLRLLVCVGELADPAVDLLCEIGCFGIQHVSSSQALDLCRRSGKKAVGHVSEFLVHPEDFVCSAAMIEELHLGGGSYAIQLSHINNNLRGKEQGLDLSPVCSQILIRMPGAQMARQYKMALERCLKVLGVLERDNLAKKPIVHGGCAFEIACFRLFFDKAHLLHSQDSVWERKAFEVLADAVLQLPVTLLYREKKNSHLASLLLGKDNQQTCFKIRCDMWRCWLEQVETSSDLSSGVETVVHKLDQLIALVDALVQLMRVSGVVLVKRQSF